MEAELPAEPPFVQADAAALRRALQKLINNANGDTPLNWTSWYRRSGDILEKLRG